jgi:uncharacterized protein (TIGR02594 family)
MVESPLNPNANKDVLVPGVYGFDNLKGNNLEMILPDKGLPANRKPEDFISLMPDTGKPAGTKAEDLYKPMQVATVQPTATPAPQAAPQTTTTPAPQATPQGGAPDPMANLARMAGVDLATGKQIIQKYLKDGGVGLNPEELAWCAAAMNASLAQVGLPGTGSQRALSFLKYGTPVTEPQHGDIVVFQRGGPNSGLGHVAYVDQINPDGTIRVLGGNQSQGIGYATYDTKDVLGYRRIPGAVAVTDPEKIKNTGSTQTPLETAGDALQKGLQSTQKTEEAQKPFQMSPLQPTVSLPSQPFATGAKDAYAQLLEKTPSLQGDRNPQPVARTPAVSTPPKAFMQPQQEQQNEQPQT